MRLRDLTGESYGRLTVLERHGTHRYRNSSRPIWRCRCECGALVLRSRQSITRGTGGCDVCIGRVVSSDHMSQHILANGYVMVYVWPDHPWFKYARTTVSRHRTDAEHRLVMMEHLGRKLTQDESVHHINGERGDNRIENLQLRMRHHGLGQKHQCLDCGSHNIERIEL